MNVGTPYSPPSPEKVTFGGKNLKWLKATKKWLKSEFLPEKWLKSDFFASRSRFLVTLVESPKVTF